jgi:hypothetical protein
LKKVSEDFYRESDLDADLVKLMGPEYAEWRSCVQYAHRTPRRKSQLLCYKAAIKEAEENARLYQTDGDLEHKLAVWRAVCNAHMVCFSSTSVALMPQPCSW